MRGLRSGSLPTSSTTNIFLRSMGCAIRGRAAPLPDAQPVFAARVRQPRGVLAAARSAGRYRIRCSTTLNIGVLRAFSGDRRGDAQARLDVRQSRLLQHPLHHHVLGRAGARVLPALPRDIQAPHGSGAERPVRTCGIQYRAHAGHRRRGGLPLPDGLEDRRSAAAHQGRDRVG